MFTIVVVVESAPASPHLAAAASWSIQHAAKRDAWELLWGFGAGERLALMPVRAVALTFVCGVFGGFVSIAAVVGRRLW